MEVLDLHGVKHEDAEIVIEDFILSNASPCKIITGNSHVMRNLVAKVLSRHGMRSEPESDYNLGALITYDF